MHTAPLSKARDYLPLLDKLKPGKDFQHTMSLVCDGLWDAFSTRGVSWVGFYLPDPTNHENLILGPRRDKPACSPIGLHGVCGRGFVGKRPVIVRDVIVMGSNYIACDPRDKSELVIPMINPDGSCAGVIDIDSHDIGAFTMHDALCVWRLLRHLGLSAHGVEDERLVEVL